MGIILKKLIFYNTITTVTRMQSGTGGFNQTQGSISGNPASLKGKLMNLEEMIKTIQEEMNFHKREVSILKSEKETLESVLTMKTQDVKKSLSNELMRIEEEMKRHFDHF